MSHYDQAESELMAEDYTRDLHPMLRNAARAAYLSGYCAGAEPRVVARPEEALLLGTAALAYRRHYLALERSCWLPVASQLRLGRFDPDGRSPRLEVYELARRACADAAARAGLRTVEIFDLLGPRFVVACAPGAPLPVLLASQVHADVVRVDGVVTSVRPGLGDGDVAEIVAHA